MVGFILTTYLSTSLTAGKVTTYKEIAKEVGSPHAHRAVGSSLRRNPYAPVVRLPATFASAAGTYIRTSLPSLLSTTGSVP